MKRRREGGEDAPIDPEPSSSPLLPPVPAEEFGGERLPSLFGYVPGTSEIAQAKNGQRPAPSHEPMVPLQSPGAGDTSRHPLTGKTRPLDLLACCKREIHRVREGEAGRKVVSEVFGLLHTGLDGVAVKLVQEMSERRDDWQVRCCS